MAGSKDNSGSRRGRPSPARASAIDRLILEHARALFLAEGFDAVAMEQVAAAARISKGTLYARHSSKEALFTAVTLDLIAQWAQAAAQYDHLLTDDIAQRLRHHAHLMVRSMLRPDVVSFQRVLRGIKHRFPQLADAVSGAGYRHIVDIIRGDILAAAERDGRPVKDAEGVALTIVSAIGGFDLYAVTSGKLTVEQFLAHADRTIELAMAARAAW
ncbi:TetR/AcrR family transcriptional regulator [Caenibius sp. WL]|uniref:TetR/AcrR family transcriptional regulator n=1 Tax=Caenibius sp. WL TaxID=2872646 RepID=UPI001C993ADD|nr:TetR/AcrR family transcriptional regulator [Caenibius sp. WL]QZP07833.1 TetR/AcrR family transcriptional regulator [Caenibius sp. WL]